MALKIDQNLTNRTPNTTSGPNKPFPSTKSEQTPLNRENGSCCISPCLFRIWNCVAKALKNFVDWLLCRSAKKNKPENPSFVSSTPNASSSLSSSKSSIVQEIPKIFPSEGIVSLSTGIPEQVPTRDQTVASPSLATATHVNVPPTSDKTQIAPVPQSQVDAASSISQANATAEEFVACVEGGSLNIAEAQEFVNRGGILNLAIQGKPPIAIQKNVQMIAGCSAGVNRSQVAAAELTNMGVKVVGVLSGRMMRGEVMSSKGIGITSLFNQSPDQILNFFPDQFFEIFGMKKWDQIGRDFAISIPIDETGDWENITDEQAKRTQQIKAFFQKYINELGPTHFITFSESGPEVLKCLLKRDGSLAQFTITFSPMDDAIQRASYFKNSEKIATAYRAFGERIRQHFNVVNLD